MNVTLDNVGKYANSVRVPTTTPPKGRPPGHPINGSAWDDIVDLTGRGLTEIATAADVPRSTLSGIVRGHQNASTTTAHKIAHGARCRVGTLFPTLTAELREAVAS